MPTRKRARPAGGRPKGSANRDYVIVAQRPASCPTCGSTARRVAPGSPPRVNHHAGTDRDGRPFDRIVRQRYQCACGQWLEVMTLEQIAARIAAPPEKETKPASKPARGAA